MECPSCNTPNADGARFCAKCGALLPAEKDEADPLIGTKVGGRYNIVKVLGEGGMGRVYNAEQQMGTTVRKVAVKTLLSEYARDQKVVERFMRECATVVELEHPNTIKFYDYGKTDAGDLYIAMELLTGATLEEVLEKGAVVPDRVDKIVGQICGSLQEAHEKGIVHRDLKPANIFLTTRVGEEDYVKVLDFGIAKRDDKHSKAEAKLTQQGTVLGTPPYMSPEQFRGQELDKTSDIYSLGVMAYEMLTGRLPFDADTPWAWATQHMTAQPFPFETVPLGSSVPPKMKAAVMRALSKDKKQRQQSVKEFFDEFTLGVARSSGTGVPRASAADLAAASAAAQMGRSGPMASAQTQVGEPIFVGAPIGVDQVSSPTGPQQSYHSSPGMPMPSSPGMPVVGGMPTGSGQAYPPPPPAQAKKGGSGAIIGGIVALIGVVAIVGVALALKGNSHSGKENADAGVTTTSVDAGKAEEDAGAAEPTASPSGSASAPPVATTPNVNKPPVGDPHADQACRQCEIAANRDQLAEARSHFSRCEGSAKPGARMAIEQAEIRARNLHRPPPPPPCRGKHCPR
jgi:serine/threonine-protein kinase